MASVDKTYKDFEELTFEEFHDILWEIVPERSVSTLYLDKNDDFSNNFTFDMYQLFERTPGLTIGTVGRFTESMFFNLFRFRPMLHNLEELPDRL